jgi:hypothetical protein
MVDAGGAEGVQLTLNPNEDLPIPFAFITMTTHGKPPHKVRKPSPRGRERPFAQADALASSPLL